MTDSQHSSGLSHRFQMGPPHTAQSDSASHHLAPSELNLSTFRTNPALMQQMMGLFQQPHQPSGQPQPFSLVGSNQPQLQQQAQHPQPSPQLSSLAYSTPNASRAVPPFVAVEAPQPDTPGHLGGNQADSYSRMLNLSYMASDPLSHSNSRAQLGSMLPFLQPPPQQSQYQQLQQQQQQPSFSSQQFPSNHFITDTTSAKLELSMPMAPDHGLTSEMSVNFNLARMPSWGLGAPQQMLTPRFDYSAQPSGGKDPLSARSSLGMSAANLSFNPLHRSLTDTSLFGHMATGSGPRGMAASTATGTPVSVTEGMNSLDFVSSPAPSFESGVPGVPLYPARISSNDSSATVSSENMSHSQDARFSPPFHSQQQRMQATKSSLSKSASAEFSAHLSNFGYDLSSATSSLSAYPAPLAKEPQSSSLGRVSSQPNPLDSQMSNLAFAAMQRNNSPNSPGVSSVGSGQTSQGLPRSTSLARLQQSLSLHLPTNLGAQSSPQPDSQRLASRKRSVPSVYEPSPPTASSPNVGPAALPPLPNLSGVNASTSSVMDSPEFLRVRQHEESLRGEKLRKHREVEVRRRKRLNDAFQQLADLSGFPADKQVKKSSVLRHLIEKLSEHPLTASASSNSVKQMSISHSSSTSSSLSQGSQIDAEKSKRKKSSADEDMADDDEDTEEDELGGPERREELRAKNGSADSTSKVVFKLGDNDRLQHVSTAALRHAPNAEAHESFQSLAKTFSISVPVDHRPSSSTSDNFVMFATFSLQGVFLQCGNRLASTLGYEVKELVDNKTLFHVSHPDSMAASSALLLSVVTAPIDLVLTNNILLIKKDGSPLPARITAWLLAEQGSSPTSFKCVVQPL